MQKDALFQTIFEFLQVFKDIGIEIEFTRVRQGGIEDA
jgi:hypothetical protein